MDNLYENLMSLIRKASTDIPDDVEKAIKVAYEREDEGTRAKNVFTIILNNIELARKNGLPVCQDTGTLLFFIDMPFGYNSKTLKETILRAVRDSTRIGILRPNAVDAITQKNSGDNIGIGSPFIHIEESDSTEIKIRLILKGGGSENVSIQYSLPDQSISASRDIEGIKKCILDAAFKAQGFGCAPGVLAVGVGGDRMTSYLCAKEQLLRRLDDKNPDEVLHQMECELYDMANMLGIGPMGFGGKTTVLGVKIGKRHRVPASFFVSIAYMCWAFRRAEIKLRV
ncbi:MAG: fumarate hydratase [Myxococcota bacterium]